MPWCPFQYNPQLKSCGSIEAWLRLSRSTINFCPIRNWKVAAPLKRMTTKLIQHRLTDNPQLKSCGSIEAIATMTMILMMMMTIRNWKVAAPLKHPTQHTITPTPSAIRNWKVAAPLKLTHVGESLSVYGPIRNWKVAAPLKLVSGINTDIFFVPAIRNWKVAAPLKLGNYKTRYIHHTNNPQLKSCGSIEAPLRPLWRLRSFCNPQLKSCGSIEATSDEMLTWWCWHQSATEKLRLHWSKGVRLFVRLDYLQSATEKLRLHWSGAVCLS